MWWWLIGGAIGVGLALMSEDEETPDDAELVAQEARRRAEQLQVSQARQRFKQTRNQLLRALCTAHGLDVAPADLETVGWAKTRYEAPILAAIDAAEADEAAPEPADVEALERLERLRGHIADERVSLAQSDDDDR